MKMRVTSGSVSSEKHEWLGVSTNIYDIQIIMVNSVFVALFHENQRLAFKTVAPSLNGWVSRPQPYPEFMKKWLGPRWERARVIPREELKKEFHKLLMQRAVKFFDAQLTREDNYDD